MPGCKPGNWARPDPFHEARCPPDGAARGASRRTIAVPMGKARNVAMRRLARNRRTGRESPQAALLVSYVHSAHRLPRALPAAIGASVALMQWARPRPKLTQ